MKMKKIAVALLLTIIMLSSTVFAANVSSADTTLVLVEDNTCTIQITDESVFTKKLTNVDTENKELTLTLTVNNNTPSPLSEPSEIVLLIDNSYSMNANISSGGKRMEALQRSAKILATELMKIETVQVSVVSFSEVNSQELVIQAGQEQNPDLLQPRGTINDAKVRTGLTTDLNTVLEAIDAVAEGTDKGVLTNLDAGITLASQQLSGECLNQYIVILSDGVPNLCIEPGMGPRYSDETADETISTLTRFVGQGIHFITMLTGVEDEQVDDYRPEHEGLTYADCAEEIFGTPENPKFGPYYFVTDDKIEKTVAESILNKLVAPDGGVLTGIDIYDYFPAYIVNNFDIELGTPSTGEVEMEGANKFLWHIDRLSPQEKATLVYKLKVKENIDETIINQVLDTNEKVDITTEEGIDKTSNVTPKVKLLIPDDDPIEAVVTVKYLEKGTNKTLAENTTLKGPVNDPYKATRKAIKGYTAAEPEPDNKEGLFTEQPITVIFYYEKIQDDTVAPGNIPQTGATILFSMFVITTLSFTLSMGYKTFIKNRDLK